MTIKSKLMSCCVALAALGLFTTAGVPVSAQAGSGLREFLRTSDLHGLLVDPNDSARLILATHTGLHGVDLLSLRTQPIGTARDDFMGFSADPSQPGRVFASGHPAEGGNIGIIGSQDGGLTWVTLAPGVDGPVDFHQMEVSRANPAWLFGVYGGSDVQQSRDNGLSWQSMGRTPEGLIDIATSARDPELLYAATRAGLWQSPDGGATWALLRDSTAPVSFVDVGTDGMIHAFVLGEGLIRAEETLLDWTALNNGFADGYILHFARDTQDPARMFAATGENELLVSPNGGVDWSLVAKP